MARGDFVRRIGRSGVRWIRFMELDVAARQEARGDNHGGAHAVLFQLEAKSVIPSGLASIEGSCPEIDITEQVGLGCPADITIFRSVAATVEARIEISRNLRAADVQPGEHAGSVVVDEIEVAVISAVFASRHQAKVGVIALIGNHESSAGREIARGRKHVGRHG